MKEEWRDLPGFEGFYMVSNLGKVKSMIGKWKLAEHILKDFNIGRGYRYVTLSVHGERTNMLVHRAVALAFIKKPNTECEVNHKNGDKTDNRASNLEWVSHKRNIRHAINTLGATSTKKKVICIGDGSIYDSISDAARWAGVGENKMSLAISSGAKIHGEKWIML